MADRNIFTSCTARPLSPFNGPYQPYGMVASISSARSASAIRPDVDFRISMQILAADATKVNVFVFGAYGVSQLLRARKEIKRFCEKDILGD